MSKTDFFMIRCLNSSTRIAGASRLSEAISRYAGREHLGDQVGVEDRPGAVAGGVHGHAAGVGLRGTPRASGRSTTHRPCPSRSPASPSSSWRPTCPCRGHRAPPPRSTLSKTSSRPRALPGRLSLTASHSDSARPVRQTKCTGKTPLACHQSTWVWATREPGGLVDEPAVGPQHHRARACACILMNAGSRVVEELVDVGLRRSGSRPRSVGSGGRALGQLAVLHADHVGVERLELVPGQGRSLAGCFGGVVVMAVPFGEGSGSGVGGGTGRSASRASGWA